jgi:quinoprotein glucose dehydrogenase
VWPIVERPVPQSTTKNPERTSPTQPIPTKPPAIDKQGSLPEHLIDFTPALRARALENLQHFKYGPIFTPPSDEGTLTIPSSLGGPNWGGAAFDPETGIYYVPTRFTNTILRARYPAQQQTTPSTGNASGPQSSAPGQSGAARQTAGQTGAAGQTAPGAPNPNDWLVIDGLPIFKPPYARVSAVDMNKGEILWQTPIGNGPRHHPLLKDLSLPPLGDAIMGAAPLVTRTLLFVGVTNTFVTGQMQPTAWAKFNDPGWERKLLYVFDKKTGAILHVIEMDALSMAAPMTYLHNGKQYLVVAAGNGESTELVAFTLP